MKLLYWGKDGGKDSAVSGFWPIEWKSLFSICLLRFSNGSRDAYHSHAFSSISWVLKGKLIEDLMGEQKVYGPSLKPILTSRDTMHRVTSVGTTWVLSFRGPWTDTWTEFLPDQNKYVTLTHGRQVVNE